MQTRSGFADGYIGNGYASIGELYLQIVHALFHSADFELTHFIGHRREDNLTAECDIQFQAGNRLERRLAFLEHLPNQVGVRVFGWSDLQVYAVIARPLEQLAVGGLRRAHSSERRACEAVKH